MYKALAALFFLGLTVPEVLFQPAESVYHGPKLSWVTFFLNSDVMPSDIQRTFLDNPVVQKKRILA